MPKNYKVKRYYGDSAGSYRAKPRLITVLFVIFLLVLLGYLGTVIWGPVSEFIADLGKPVDVSSLPVPEPAPESEPEPEPIEPPEPQKPVLSKMSAVFLPHAIAAEPSSLAAFLDNLSGTDVTCVMVEIKNPAGDVLFRTQNPQANEWDLVVENALELSALNAALTEKGLSLAVRMSAFRDPQAASKGRIGYAIAYQDSDFLWLDEAPENGGLPWLNPYSLAAAGYLQSLALEAIDLGAEYVALENVQFPDNSGIYATFGDGVLGMSRADVLKSFMSELEEKAALKSARVAVWFPVTAVTRTDGQENRYGGTILGTVGAELALNVSPSQYGGDINLNGLVITAPIQNPTAAVSSAVSYVKRGLSSDTKLTAVLSGPFNNLSALLEAARTAGAEEYVLFDEEGNYTLNGGVLSADTQP